MDRRRFVMLAAAALPLAGYGIPATAFNQAPSPDGDDL